MTARRARLGLALLCALLAAYYVATPAALFGSKAQGDGYLGFHHLPALLLHHTVDMRPTNPRAEALFDPARGGQRANRNPLGPALAMLPIYSVTVAIEAAARAVAPRAAGLDGPPYAVNELQTFWSGLTTLAAGLAAALLLFRLLRRRFGSGPALGGVAAALLATPLCWYLAVQPHYQHGLAFAAVTLILTVWERGLGALAPRRFFVLGLLCGLATLLRPQEAVTLAIPLSELLRQPRPLARFFCCGAALATGAVVGALPQLLCYAALFGPLVRPLTLELLRPDAPAVIEVLFSTRCGLFPWTPLVYAALPGLVALALARDPARRGLALAALSLVVVDVGLVACSWAWSGYFSFGSRRLSDLAPAWALGVAALLAARPWSRPTRATLAAFLTLCVVLNLSLCELLRRRVLPSSGAAALPAYRVAEKLGAPRPLRRALRAVGSPFVQPAGWLFALQHGVPASSFEAVVGNYALEREAHDLSVSGDRWDLTSPIAEDFAPAGLAPREPDAADRRLIGPLRLLLQPFAQEPIDGTFLGQLTAPCALAWDGHPLPVEQDAGAVRFRVPRALVRAHRVAELTLTCAAPTRLRELVLRSTTRWWRGETGEGRPPALDLRSR